MLKVLTALFWLMSIGLGVYVIKHRQTFRLETYWTVLLAILYLLFIGVLTYLMIFMLMFGYNS